MISLCEHIKHLRQNRFIGRIYNNIPSVNRIQPRTKSELKGLINNTIKEQGAECDLNFIDTSRITDMRALFADSEFNGDISLWNVSNVTTMTGMFYYSSFDGDISKWDMRKVISTESMFEHSPFNGDITRWDTSGIMNMCRMFCESEFDGDISSWDVSNVKDMSGMFAYSKFNGDLSSWDVSDVDNMRNMFASADKFSQDVTKWDKWKANKEFVPIIFEDSKIWNKIKKLERF